MFRNCFAFVEGQCVPSTVPAEIVTLGFDTAKAEERRDREKNRGRIFEILYMIISYLFGRWNEEETSDQRFCSREKKTRDKEAYECM
jgi:hypothetical protein